MFGLGSGCDRWLCEETAKAGRGSCCIVMDGGHELNGQVIMALSLAMEPSLKQCSLAWNDKVQMLDEVFRYQSVISSQIIQTDVSPELFENLSFSFKSKNDPSSNLPIDLEFTKLAFTELTGEAASDLIKFAAFQKIQKTMNKTEKIKLSVHYQILCDETSMIGVVKQETKSSEKQKDVSFSFDQFVPQIKEGPDPLKEMERAKLAGRSTEIEKQN